MKIKVKSHRRKGRVVHKHIRNIPQKKGSLWHGDKAIHGPRLERPKEFDKIWISKEQWPLTKWFTKQQQDKVKKFAKKEHLKLRKDFPKSTKVKVGVVKDGKLKPQSFMTPLGSSPKVRLLHWPSKEYVTNEEGQPLAFEYPIQAQKYIEKRLDNSRAFNIVRLKK